MRKVKFANGEHYHIFNRGVDKRNVFMSKEDLVRFFQGMNEFNVIDPIESLYANSLKKKKILRDSVSEDSGGAGGDGDRLVNFISYCLNPNHYHFILEQLVDNGIAKFMHRLGVGYTMSFNKKYDRSGSLFQGKYKAVHINSNEYLLQVSAYVNLNDKVHSLRDSVSKLVKSSWSEYVEGKSGFCEKGIILEQFNSVEEYKDFAESSLVDILERKDMEKLLLE